MEKKRTIKQRYYREIFDALLDISMNKKFPKGLYGALDAVAKYCGDIASGRRP